ncbi:MAG: acyl-CoA/acyl-ACP dehydrogenase [Planctomycetota bacterium]|nr:acyl-CoA/acyl-ACP dehydrogenase [Planctomycetota bacterium]
MSTDETLQLDEAFESLCNQLADSTADLDRDDAWPSDQFQWLSDARVLGWLIPRHFGGSEVTAEHLTVGYERLAAACLVTAFVLTQRNGACQRIAASPNDELKSDLLADLCTSAMFATVGISHLTTSRQHLKKPSVQVRETDSGFVFDGFVPWVTGAKHADVIVTGGTLSDGRQLLAAVETSLAGVEVLAPAKLMALTSSQTGPVTLTDVQVPHSRVIAGPMEQVMKNAAGAGTGSVTTSALALGAAKSSIDHVRVEALQRPELNEIVQSLDTEYGSIRDDMYDSIREGASSNPRLSSESVRQRANSLVLRASQAHLATSKGAGFAKGHPAERAVREAMFFLVWSCPQPVLAAALREFACLAPEFQATLGENVGA